MSSLPIKVKYLSTDVKEIIMPKVGDLGIDLYANEDCYLDFGRGTCLLSTGISLELPNGYALILKDRSSKSEHFSVLAGVIDSSYRGEIKIRVVCVNGGSYKISNGDKVAQGIVVQDLNSKFFLQKVDTLNTTARGNAGFGSTGK